MHFFLTNKISATMDQFKFRNTCPKNTNTKHTMAFVLAKHEAKKSRGALINNPKAQIKGSACSYLLRKRCDNHMPNGTPESPANIVIIPKVNETLENVKNY